MARAQDKVTVTERIFTVVFEPVDEGGYVVTVPAIPGIATQGETLDEARDMAVDLIEGYLEILREDGRPLPDGEEHAAKPIRDAVTVRVAAE